MAETIETTLERVFAPEEGSNKPWAALADGKRFVTFDDKLGKTLSEVAGRRGKLEYGVKEKNGYTNYYINSFEPMETLDEELKDRGTNGAAPNYRQPTHPRDQASMRRDRAIQMAQAHLQYLPDDQRTISSVDALFKQYLEILEGDAQSG